MILRQFPDIQWLKRRIAVQAAAGEGWPTCVLNVKSGTTAREDITGPFSLFMNLSGESVVRTGKGSVRVNAHNFVLTNSQQDYSLYVPKESQAETLNIHFGQAAFDGIFHALSQTDDQLLDNPVMHRRADPLFPFHSAFRTERMAVLGRQLLAHPEEEETLLLEMAREVARPYVHSIRRAQHLHQLKASTRQETLRRLHLALDLLHAGLQQPLSVDQLAQAAAMSKFHFLRAFKEAFGLSPHQYLKELRTRRAVELLRQTSLPVMEIAWQVGLENATSLSRMVQQMTGHSPTQVRMGAPSPGDRFSLFAMT